MIFSRLLPVAALNRRCGTNKRRGLILCDLLFASALALSAALIVLESASMLVRKSSFVKKHRDETYALIALIEEVRHETNDGVVMGKMGWRAEISPAETTTDLIPMKTVVITGGSGKKTVSFAWTLRVGGS